MKINTTTTKPNIVLAAILAHTMCFTVILSHLHATDAASLLSQPGLNRMATTDITAKALGDLHHHIDKASLKSIHLTPSTAARVRELQPLAEKQLDDSFATRVQSFMLRLRMVASICFQAI